MSLEIAKKLDNLSKKSKQQSIYFELRHYIELKQNYLKTVDERDRGIGKTYSLIQLSLEYGCPIIVGTKIQKEVVETKAKEEFKRNVITYIPDELQGARLNLALCEEGIAPHDLEKKVQPVVKVLVGYRYYPLGVSVKSKGGM